MLSFFFIFYFFYYYCFIYLFIIFYYYFCFLCWSVRKRIFKMLNFNATTNNYHHLSENVIFILSSFRLICFPSLLFFIFFYYYCFIYFLIFFYYYFCFLCRSLRKRVQKKLNFNATTKF